MVKNGKDGYSIIYQCLYGGMQLRNLISSFVKQTVLLFYNGWTDLSNHFTAIADSSSPITRVATTASFHDSNTACPKSSEISGLPSRSSWSRVTYKSK